MSTDGGGPNLDVGWYFGGYPGHFIGSADCRFHLSTVIPNGWLVSTVGDYHPKGHKGPGPETLGADGRTFETMVFPCAGLDDDMNPVNGLDPAVTRGYTDSRDAERGHYELCRRYAAINPGENDGA